MLTHLCRETPNRRFVLYVALLYILALTAGSLIPASSAFFALQPFIKLALLPLAQWFLLYGAKARWPHSTFVGVAMASTCFYLGLAAQTVANAIWF